MRETDILMPHARVDSERHVRDEDVLNIVHDDTSASSRQVTAAAGFFHIAAWRTSRENQWCPFHFQGRYRIP
jgi:hypothetical protein